MESEVTAVSMKEILKILERDARTTPEQISTMTDISVDDVKAKIKDAEEKRIIVKYGTTVNWEMLGEERVWALIEVRIQPERDAGFDTVARRIYGFPQVHSAYLVSGDYDLAALVVGSNMQEVAAFVAHKLAPLEGVQGTVTHFLLKRYKVDGEILDGDGKARRLPVTL